MTDKLPQGNHGRWSLCRARVHLQAARYTAAGHCWDYGPLGIEQAEHKGSRWRSMVRNRRRGRIGRGNIMHPQVWWPRTRAGLPTSVECKSHLRYRADTVQGNNVLRAVANSPSRQFNLMFKTFWARWRTASLVYLRRGHLRQLPERTGGIAQETAIRHRADRKIVPQQPPGNFVFRTRIRTNGDGVLRQAGHRPAVVFLLG